MDINHDGRVMKNGAQLWMVGTDTAKDQIYRALEGEEGYGTIHFPSGLPDEFFAQLTAEHVHRKRLNGRELRVWQLPAGKRNEILDLFVYATAALERAGVRRANWDHIEARVNPAMRDLFAPEPEPTPEPEPAPPAPPETILERVAATEDGPGAATPVPPAAPAVVLPPSPRPPANRPRAAKPARPAPRRPVLIW
jgi:phage terminase large subunit GpA-like protein